MDLIDPSYFANAATDAMGPATFAQTNPLVTGMSVPSNPVGWSGQQNDPSHWYDNLFKGPNMQKFWQQMGSLGQQTMQSANRPQGVLAQPMMGGGYHPQQQQRQAPVLAMIHPSTRIY